MRSQTMRANDKGARVPMKRLFSLTSMSFVVFWLVLFSFTKHHLKDHEDIPLAFQQGRGADALPVAVQEMAVVAQARAIKTFRLSNALTNDVLVYQRSIEYLYPVRISDNAGFMFAIQGEDVSNTCRLIQSGIKVSLHDCTPQPQ
ncbi:hypothetical protein [Hydrogenophaga sp. OTU3427]|uniref:hypothetical protein n=1 Tax=Hydrogenophaga sp. OTU3427 TaxID=3043856 RepID=UPI00313ED93B